MLELEISSNSHRKFRVSENSEEDTTHFNAREPKLHAEIRSNICPRYIWKLTYNEECKTKRHQQKQKIYYCNFTKIWREIEKKLNNLS